MIDTREVEAIDRMTAEDIVASLEREECVTGVDVARDAPERP